MKEQLEVIEVLYILACCSFGAVAGYCIEQAVKRIKR